MTLPVDGYQLKGISPRAFEHPADRAATAALASIPGLDQVVRKLIELGYERALRAAYLGSSVRLGPPSCRHVEPAQPGLPHARPRRRARAVHHAVPGRQRVDDRRRAGRSWSSTPSWCGCWASRSAARCWPTRPRTCSPTTSCTTRRLTILLRMGRSVAAAGHRRAAADGGPQRADGVVPRGRALVRPRGRARHARPGGGVPHADDPGRRRRGRRPRPRRSSWPRRRTTRTAAAAWSACRACSSTSTSRIRCRCAARRS